MAKLSLILYFSDAKNKIRLLKQFLNMRMKTHHVFFILLLSMLSAFGTKVNAQDASFPGTETNDMEMDREKEKMMFSPGELDPSISKTQAATKKDSVALRPTTISPKIQPAEPAKTPGKQPAHEDDSILSFNFLYYIFQKYKLQE
jgi:hypothetical protein